MANKYSAGSLNLSIEGVANDVIKTLDAVLKRLNLIDGALGGVKGKNKSLDQKNGFLNAAKWGANIYMARRMGRAVAKIVVAGSDYLETMNLWQVAMRNNLDLADEFVNKMNKAYGVSTKTTMQAQATFKNMIGSLGDLSDETAYKLSEAITQMAFDYSSLYNVKLSQAVDKFQSALAGQVRPIRSISGYDITEKTIHALYQSIGGTKTQRQLSRTEKQLLAILAVFKQMEASGALGDMGKTLNQFANQSRMMVEYWTELKSWTGLVLKDLLDQGGVMVTLNAFLITITEIVKAIAKSKGIGDDNFVEGIFESAENANDAVDELQGKLLDFDKFRSLSGQETGADVAIDQKLLEAISGYTSVVSEANNEAAKLAETWLKFWLNDDGTLTEQAKIFLEVLKLIGAILAVLVGASMISAVAKLGSVLGVASGTMSILVLGFGTLIYGVMNFISAWDDMSSVQRATSIIVSLVAAVVALAIALKATSGNWVAALGLSAAVAGGALSVASSLKIPNYEMGASDIDSGTVFRAGEFGKTEAVYTGSNGKTNVANISQMRQAFYGALQQWTSDYLDDELEGMAKISAGANLTSGLIYTAVKTEAKRRGEKFANV